MDLENTVGGAGADKAFEVFLPKVQDFASKGLDNVNESELSGLINESNEIELNTQNQQIFSTLVDLRRALFRDDKPSESAEVLMQKLQSLV